MSSGSGHEERIQKGTEDLAESLQGEGMDQIWTLIGTFLQHGKLPAEAFGFTSEKLEAIYGQAYRLYNTGKFKEAADLFRLLAMANPAEAKYQMGLAACFHMKKEFKNAIQTYTLATALDGTSPLPYFHLSDCFMQINDKASAYLSLEMAVKRAGEKAEFQVLKERALLTMQSLKKELAAMK